jgi:hypothetical protein
LQEIQVDLQWPFYMWLFKCKAGNFFFPNYILLKLLYATSWLFQNWKLQNIIVKFPISIHITFYWCVN